MKISKLSLVYTFIIIFVGFTTYYIFNNLNKCSGGQIPNTHQPYLNFTGSIYSTIQKYYWKKLSDQELSKIYKKAFDESPFSINNGIKYCSTKLGVLNKLNDLIEYELLTKQLDTQTINNFVFGLNQYVVKHLDPDEKISEIIENKTVDQRLNLARNIMPEVNAYKLIDVTKEAGSNEILIQCQKLSTNMMTQDQIKSCNTLADPVSREIYDVTGAFSSLRTDVNNNLFYVKADILSPTFIYELEEKLQRYFEDYSGRNEYYLILDLRQSPGGQIDVLNYMLSQFFIFGDEMYRIKSQIVGNPTSTIALKNLRYQKFNKIIILIDEHTQSASETFAEAMKKYTLSIIIGVPTLGNSSASKKNYPIEASLSTSTEYQLWLVNEMILQNDGQLIYGNGIKPDIDINKIGWDKGLNNKVPENVINILRQLFAK